MSDQSESFGGEDCLWLLLPAPSSLLSKALREGERGLNGAETIVAFWPMETSERI